MSKELSVRRRRLECPQEVRVPVRQDEDLAEREGDPLPELVGAGHGDLPPPPGRELTRRVQC